MIAIDPELAIPADEIRFRASGSSGPGGQNVNRTATRITLLFDLDASPSLSPEQKMRLRTRLATRINKEGVLRVVSQKHRTQAANRKAAAERFADLLRGALEEERERRPTALPRRAKERRLAAKRRRGDVKRRRGTADDWED